MRIGIVTTWFERGAAYVSKAYRDVLVEGGHEVFVFARGGENQGQPTEGWDQDFVTWGRYFPDKPMRILEREFVDWIDSRKIDVILYNEQQDWEGVLFANKHGIPSIAYVDYYTKASVPFFELYDGLICNTKRHFSVFSWHPGAIDIPWGTDTSLYVPTRSYEPGSPVVFFHSAGMGGIGLRKGTDLVIEAFRQVQGNTKLVIHSQIPADQFGESSCVIADEDRIEFVHKTVAAPGLYFKGDVYVYPSRLEGIGLTIAEALSSGLAVITTDCPPMSEFIVSDSNGMLVDVEKYIERADGYYWPESHCSIRALADAMQSYVDQPDKVKKQQIFARDHALENLSWDNNKQSLIDYFKSIAETDVQDKRNSYIYNEALIHSMWGRKEYDQKIKSIYYRMHKKVKKIFGVW